MTTDHDYVGCQDYLCQPCEDYRTGYEHGKVDAFESVEAGTENHVPGGGCRPCRAFAGRLGHWWRVTIDRERDKARPGASFTMMLN